MLYLRLLLLNCLWMSCALGQSQHQPETSMDSAARPELIILGTLQDGGSPHPGCKETCCLKLFSQPDPRRQVVCLGLIDRQAHKSFLIEATPDLPPQMKALQDAAGFKTAETPTAIFLTHAHIGHYTGLMYLGMEALNASSVPVYAMPRMASFLAENGPWSQLIEKHNIEINPLSENSAVRLSPQLSIIPFRVPHRDEFSETVGFIIAGPHKKALFIPDIDKWQKWDSSIVKAIAKVDYAFIDGSFFNGQEVGYRDISQVPHPFIIESMSLFKELPTSEKNKIHFIHFNHTNPVLNRSSKEARQVLQNGYKLSRIYQRFKL